ncbi:MAG: hypothetical protein P8Y02_09575 [Deinococcales bacterium]|jgi:hypothetical protein
MLYRRQRHVSPILVAAITAIVVFPLAFFLGRDTAPTPRLASELTPAIYAVQHAQGTLDVVDLEYARAAGNVATARPQAGASLSAAKSAAQRGLADLDQATDLARLYPDRARTARADLEALLRAIDRRAPLGEVQSLTDTLRADLAALVPAL